MASNTEISQLLTKIRGDANDFRDVEALVRILAADDFDAEILFSCLAEKDEFQKLGYLADVASDYQRFTLVDQGNLSEGCSSLREWRASAGELPETAFSDCVTDYFPEILKRTPLSYHWNVVSSLSVYDLVSDLTAEL